MRIEHPAMLGSQPSNGMSQKLLIYGVVWRQSVVPVLARGDEGRPDAADVDPPAPRRESIVSARRST